MTDFDFVDALFWFSIGVLASWIVSLAAFLWWAARAPREDEYFTRRVQGDGR